LEAAATGMLMRPRQGERGVRDRAVSPALTVPHGGVACVVEHGADPEVYDAESVAWMTYAAGGGVSPFGVGSGGREYRTPAYGFGSGLSFRRGLPM